ncbi:N-acetylglucosamine-6-phosphate deacetylase [Phaeovulum sp. W22_SRMD_FR3]|uniref:N-acetylglucosamine-6-phosphate deacetylase n=1 Tax=Phaeovulum sp. W22_SRMD_FR3 TaxID=3240274 RepID=UPI003F945F4F
MSDINAECPAVFARRLYDGASDLPQENRVIEIEAGRIRAIRPGDLPSAVAAGMPVAEIIAPGFIDLQINGANDTQFNFDPSVAALARIAAGARRGGTAHLLPTFITAPGEAYLSALTAVRAALAAKTPGILGLHLEGPFLSPARAGIHDPAAIRAMTSADLAALTAGFPGPLMLTLAPECLPEGHLAALAAAGVILSVGHSAATAAEVAAAEAAGLRCATHLFNAMSQMSGRAPGVVGAVLASDRLYAGIIADGHHVAWENIRIAVKAMGARLCLVTDAMLTLAGTAPGFALHGVGITLQGDRLTDAAGTLAGAHLAMDAAVRRIMDGAGVSLPQALRMAATHPAAALGLAAELGRVAPGYRASLTLLGEDLASCGVVVDGRYFPQD